MISFDYSIKNPEGGFRPFNLFQHFDDGIRKRMPKNIAKELYNELLQNIDTNKFGYRLSRGWLAKKKSLGADSRPFIMFRHYRNNIVVLSENGHLTVGFKRTSKHPRANVSYGELAVRLEFGDPAKGIPSRPLWRRTAKEFFLKNEKVLRVMRKSIKRG